MATARTRRRDKQYVELVQGNSKLHKDIEDLETAYMVHRQYVEKDENSVQGMIRKEVGGSRWEHGGAGKLHTYKSSKDLIDQETGANQPRPSSHKSSRPVSNEPNGFKMKQNDPKITTNLDLIGPDLDQGRLVDLKTKVLKKASSKIIRRDTWSGDGKHKSETNNVKKETNAISKPLMKDQPSSRDGRKEKSEVKRSNSLKRDKAKREAKSSLTVTSDKSRTLTVSKSSSELRNVPSNTPGNQRKSQRSSRRDSFERSSDNKSHATTNGVSASEIIYDKNVASSGIEVSVTDNKGSARGIGVTYTPRKFEPFVNGNSEQTSNISNPPSELESNFFKTKPVEPTEIYIDPVKGHIRVTSGHDDSFSDFSSLDRTRVLIQPGSPTKSIEGQRLPCTIVNENADPAHQNELRDIFGLLEFSAKTRTDPDSTGIAESRLTAAPSPFAIAKQCNSEVEFWLRGLGIPDVDKYAKIFADNDVDLTDLEFMSASQLHDMGITTFGALNGILNGVRDLKIKPPKERKTSEKKKPLDVSSIAWENGENENSPNTKPDTHNSQKLMASMEMKTDSCQNDRTFVKQSHVVDSARSTDKTFVKRSHDIDSARSRDTPSVARCSSVMSNVSNSSDLGVRCDSKHPPFAASTHSSSAKCTDKRPPSAKTSTSGNKTSTKAGSQHQTKSTGNQNQNKLRRSNSFTAPEREKPISKFSNLESKPTKGVLLKHRSSSLTRESTRHIPEKSPEKSVKKTEEKRETRNSRARSRSADAVKRKAMAGVQAAAKKYEERSRDVDNMARHVLDDKKKQRRDEMAARHLQREKFREVTGDESTDTDDNNSPRLQQAPHDTDEGLESLVTVNILSTPTKSDPKKKSLVEDKSRTHVIGSSSDVRRSLRRVEPPRRQAQLAAKPTELHMPANIEPPLLSTYKVGSKDRDRYHSEPESGYKTDGSTYSQIEDRVSDIQLKIKRLKARATSGDEMTLTLVRDLQGQLQHFERQLMKKETDGRHRNTVPVSRSDPETDQVYSARSIDSQRLSDAPESSRTEKMSSNISPISNLLAEENTRKSDELIVRDEEGVRQSKRELLAEMRKEKHQHHIQIRQLQSELQKIRHTDPVTSMELDERDITYKQEDVIGEGTFSCVYKGDYQGAEVAIKQLKTPLKSQDRNYFAAEVSLMKELRHPRVVLLIGVCTTSTLPMMVLELMSHGSLYNHLHNPDCESLDHALYYQIAKDVALGMNYLHSHKPEVLHLDLKSINVLLCQSLRAKIADFGFSKLRHEAGSKSRGKIKVLQKAPSWMSPELIDKGEVTRKSDVYSFGVILWEMLTRKTPYEGSSTFQILEKVRKNKRPEIPTCTPEGLSHLISLCWNQNPAKRPQFKETLQILENLAFPPAWRELFQKAGIPDSALQDVQSTRTIISLVTGTLDSGNTAVLHSFMIAHNKNGNESDRKQEIETKSTLKSGRVSSSSDRTSARSKNSNKDSSKPVSSRHSSRSKTNDKWEIETVSTLSGKRSSDDSDFTLKDLGSSSSDEKEESSDSSELSQEEETYIKRYLNKSNAPPKKSLNVYVPSLELSLQSARDEFKAERQRISHESDWISVSLDDKSCRSGLSSQRVTSPTKELAGNIPSFDTKLRLSSALSSRTGTPSNVTKEERESSQLDTDLRLSNVFDRESATPSNLTLDESMNMNESARTRRRNKAKDLPSYTEEYIMRESFDNRRPPSPKKRMSLTKKLMECSSSGRPTIVQGAIKSEDFMQLEPHATTFIEQGPRSVQLSKQDSINNSQDSFFGIPVNAGNKFDMKGNDVALSKNKKLTGVSSSFTKVDKELNDVSSSFTKVDKELTGVSGTFTKVDKELTEVSGSFTKVDKELAEVSSSFTKVNANLDVQRSVSNDDAMKVEDIETERKPETPKGSRQKSVFDESSKPCSSINAIDNKKENQFKSESSFAKNRLSLENLLGKSRKSPRTETKDLGRQKELIIEDKVVSEKSSRSLSKKQFPMLEKTDADNQLNQKGSEIVGKQEPESIRVVLKDMEVFDKIDSDTGKTGKSTALDKRKSTEVNQDPSQSTNIECVKKDEKDENIATVDENDAIRVKLTMEEVEKKKKPVITPRRSKSTSKREMNSGSYSPVKIAEREKGDIPVRVSLKEMEPSLLDISNLATTGMSDTCSGDQSFRRNKDDNTNMNIENVKSDTRSSLAKTKQSKRQKTLQPEGRKQPVSNVEDIPSPKKSTIRVKLRKDPIAQTLPQNNTKNTNLNPSRQTASPVPPAPPPPPPVPVVSKSVAIVTRSVQESAPRTSMADELKSRLSGRSSFSEGMRISKRHNQNSFGLTPVSNQRPVRKQPMGGVSSSMAKSGTNLSNEEPQGLLNISEVDEKLIPQQSEGLPSFMVQSMDLQDQKDHLRSISKPHPDQLDDLSNASQEQLVSIAEILKKAVMNRRLAMGEDGDSVSQSIDSVATGWSIDTCNG